MIKKRYMILSVVVASVLLGSLFYSNVILAQINGPYDPWIDTNDDGIIDVYDLQALASIYGTSGEPINKTALLLELQDRVDDLNASLIELQSEVESLDASIPKLKTFDSIDVAIVDLEAYIWYTAWSESFNLIDDSDVLILYVGTIAAYAALGGDAQLSGNFLLDDVGGEPYEQWLEADIYTDTRVDLFTCGAMQYFSSNVPAGDHTLQIQIRTWEWNEPNALLRGKVFIFVFPVEA